MQPYTTQEKKKVKITFYGCGSLGPLWIGTYLRKYGHEVVFCNEKKDSYHMGCFKVMNDEIVNTIKPDIIGFSCLEANYLDCLEKAKWVKKFHPNIITIFGGVYPTLRPEIIREDAIDYVCLGEGEIPMLDLCRSLSGESDIQPHKVSGFHTKYKGEIIKNPLSRVVENLDDIPYFPRAEVSPYYGIYVGRGCPYSCAFCSWAGVRKATNNHKVRFRSIDNILGEIENMYSVYGKAFGDTIKFQDDTFMMNTGWAEEFLVRFHKTFPKLQFFCCLRANMINEKVVKLLSDNGCLSVAIGYESGDDHIRNQVLKKNIAREQIINGSRMVTEAGIKISGQWMIGVPGETVDSILKTIELHREIKDIPYMHVCTPYYGTWLREYAVEKGLLSPDEIIDTGTYNKIFFDFSPELKAVIWMLYRIFPLVDMPIPDEYTSSQQQNYRARKFGQRDVNKKFLADHVLQDLYGENKCLI